MGLVTSRQHLAQRRFARGTRGCLWSLAVIYATRLAAVAGPDEVAAELGRTALKDPSALEIVTSLTTEAGPRLAGSETEKRASDWALNLLRKLGFENPRVERFPIEHGWARGLERAEVVSPSPQNLSVTALGGSVPTPPEGLETEVALFRTYEQMLSAPTGSLSGKIVVVTEPLVRDRDASNYFSVNRIRGAGPSEAGRRGAAGFLMRSLGTGNHRFPHTGATHYLEGAPRIPAAALSVADALQLERLVDRGAPVRVRMQLTPRDLGLVQSQNVIAEVKGREKPDEIVLLGAHLDSWDLGTGALDDGAGVAIVVAAAKLIHALPQPPRRTVRVVLFGAEEPGLLGARAYVEAHRAELDRHVIVAEPDFGQGPVHKFRTGVADPEDATVRRIRAQLAPLGIAAGDNRTRGGSDVGLLVDAGVPAADLAMDGTDYFDFHHTADDTVDKIEPDRINQSTAAYAVFGYLAAELGGNYRPAPSAK